MEEKHLVSNRTIKFTWLENKSKCIKKYNFEKSHDFHGKLDFLNFSKSKMKSMNTVKTQSLLRKRVMPYKKRVKRAMICRTMLYPMGFFFII
jgi:hypothetical protein